MAHYHGRQTGYQTWPLRNYFCSFYPFELKGWQNFVFQTMVCLFFCFSILTVFGGENDVTRLTSKFKF